MSLKMSLVGTTDYLLRRRDVQLLPKREGNLQTAVVSDGYLPTLNHSGARRFRAGDKDPGKAGGVAHMDVRSRVGHSGCTVNEVIAMTIFSPTHRYGRSSKSAFALQYPAASYVWAL